MKPERLYRRTNDHIDAYATVSDLDEYYRFCTSSGAYIYRKLTSHPWEVTDFQVEDPDGYIICFAQARASSGVDS